MSRITEIELAGTKYPLNFSVKAAKELIKRYGSLEKIPDAIAKKGELELFDELTYLLNLLMNEGKRYKQIVEHETIEIPTVDDLETIMGTMDITGLQNTLINAMLAGAKPTIETEETEEGKNAGATQED